MTEVPPKLWKSGVALIAWVIVYSVTVCSVPFGLALLNIVAFLLAFIVAGRELL